MTTQAVTEDARAKRVWRWWSKTGATAADVDRYRQAFEHTFRMMKCSGTVTVAVPRRGPLRLGVARVAEAAAVLCPRGRYR
ncbi:hypothetical protein GCM10010246_03320 [Streptomyces cuspidosporus]|uniref:Uncharacterized protein n=1 Tax=Streptomyces cuspidosporus TaxID=66882 RepID=A0ABP5S6W9_9ACTN